MHRNLALYHTARIGPEMWCRHALHRILLRRRRYSPSRSKSRAAAGPGLKDFLISTPRPDDHDDGQWERTPYLHAEDLAAKGRKGTFT